MSAEAPPLSKYNIGRSSLRKRKAPPSAETDPSAERGPVPKKGRLEEKRAVKRPAEKKGKGTVKSGDKPEAPTATTKPPVGTASLGPFDERPEAPVAATEPPARRSLKQKFEDREAGLSGPSTGRARPGPFLGPFDKRPEAPVAPTKPVVGERKRKIENGEANSGEPSTKKTRVEATSVSVPSSAIVPASGAQTASSIAAPESKIIPASKLARARKPICAAPEGIRRSNRTKKLSHKALEAIEGDTKKASSQANSSSAGGTRKATGTGNIGPQANTSSSSAGGARNATDAGNIGPQTNTSSSTGGAREATGAGNIDPQTNTSSSAGGTRKATGTGNIGHQAKTSSSAGGIRKATGAGHIGAQANTSSSTAVPRKVTRASTRGSYQEPPVVRYEWERETEQLRLQQRDQDRAAGLIPPYIRYGYKEFWRAEDTESNAEDEAKTPAQIAEYDKEMNLDKKIAPLLDLNERHEQMGFPSVLMKNKPAGRMTFLPTDHSALVQALNSMEDHVDLEARWAFRDHTQNPISDERTPMPEPEELKEARDQKLLGHYDYKPPFRHFFSKDADVEKFFPEMGVAADSSQHAQDNTIEGQREYVPYSQDKGKGKETLDN